MLLPLVGLSTTCSKWLVKNVHHYLQTGYWGASVSYIALNWTLNVLKFIAPGSWIWSLFHPGPWEIHVSFDGEHRVQG